MAFVIVIVVCLIVGIPITLLVFAARQANLSRRITELEADVRALKIASTSRAKEAPSRLETLLEARREAPAHARAPAFAAAEPESTGRSAPPPLPSFEAPRITSPEKQPVTPQAPPVLEPVATVPAAAGRIVDWEKFLGVKLFAWVGGLALFLGIAFFIKYSFEHNLVPPGVRVALGFITGIGLVIGGILMRRKEYAVTSQTLCATGVVALYAVTFATHAVYHLLGAGTVFALMSLITAAAFTLAVRLDAKVVAVLGLAGGFLTPPLLSTGQDNPLGLFGYVTLLDVGLLAVAFNRRWHFLVLLGAIGTAIMELGWMFEFFRPEKTPTLVTVLGLFNAIQIIGFVLCERGGQSNRHSVIASVIQAAVSYFAALFLISTAAMASRPGAILATILIADLALLIIPLLRNDLFRVQLIASGATLCAIGAWLQFSFREQDLYWALGATLAFALLHSVYPLLLQKRRNVTVPISWLNIFPLGAIGLMLILLLQLGSVTLALWPVVFLLDLLVIGLAFLSASFVSALAAVLLTGIFTTAWLFRIPQEVSGGGLVLMIGLFAVLFFGAGIWLGKRSTNRPETAPYLPAFSAILPFLLLALMIVRLELSNPSHIFGLGLVLSALLLWLGKRTGTDQLHVTALGASLFLQYFWHVEKMHPDNSGIALTWYLAFYAMFTLVPFVFRKGLEDRVWPWVSAALSGPLHFYLIYKTTLNLAPGFNGMGLLPALLAIPSIVALATVMNRFHVNEEQRTRLVALFGGSALFFITMVFPIQVSRQWLTIGWALEGVALLWLYRRAPHRGLPIVAVALLSVAFARLALNPMVFSYYPRSEVRILNWYLYSYGIVSACLLVGAQLLSPPRHLVLGRNSQPLLYSLGTILAFILLNIEIADFFADGNFLRFEFSGNFARDMTYSIAWALFALGLLLIGIRKDLPPVRYASLALLGVTLIKLFFHDLSRLGQLYRIGAFIGVAIILILASWFYQRFLASTASLRKQA